MSEPHGRQNIRAPGTVLHLERAGRMFLLLELRGRKTGIGIRGRGNGDNNRLSSDLEHVDSQKTGLIK